MKHQRDEVGAKPIGELQVDDSGVMGCNVRNGRLFRAVAGYEYTGDAVWRFG
jgi:hypothetical protein